MELFTAETLTINRSKAARLLAARKTGDARTIEPEPEETED